jgi:hypothetical protein
MASFVALGRDPDERGLISEAVTLLPVVRRPNTAQPAWQDCRYVGHELGKCNGGPASAGRSLRTMAIPSAASLGLPLSWPPGRVVTGSLSDAERARRLRIAARQFRRVTLGAIQEFS